MNSYERYMAVVRGATPDKYLENVYAGVLGKIIGVYAGRPIEGWPHARIARELGEIRGYVNERLNVPLVVTDDDIIGTLTFIRALEDHAQDDPDALTSAEIGETWLNYLIENKTVLWWGGLGVSTEHTAYLRLTAGIAAPRSGSITLNSQLVAEQIGAQIFIDGWGLVCPGDPCRAAAFAEKAARVSHDGEAVCAAQAVAAMVAHAFVETHLDRLLDTAQALLPAGSHLASLYRELRSLHRREPDWRAAFAWIEANYGYARFGGGCHVIPNHALIVLALLWSAGDFDQAMLIVNTAGWDTDCNAANVGCILGVRGGLAGLSRSYDWRGPVADRVLLPGADAGNLISDAAREALRIANIGRRLAGEAPLAPKQGARFHFSLPGAVQGFRPTTAGLTAQQRTETDGTTALRVTLPGDNADHLVLTPVFITAETAALTGYGIHGAPAIYPGQTVRARIMAAHANTAPLQVALCATHHCGAGATTRLTAPAQLLTPGQAADLTWTLPTTGGQPYAELGLTAQSAVAATLDLDYLTWDGVPEVCFDPPQQHAELWRRQFADATDAVHIPWLPHSVIANRTRGFRIIGCRAWHDYIVSADMRAHIADAFGLAVAWQGLRRYVALLVGADRQARILHCHDGAERVLAAAACPFDWSQPLAFRLMLAGRQLTAQVGTATLTAQLPPAAASGAIAAIVERGMVAVHHWRIAPATP